MKKELSREVEPTSNERISAGGGGLNNVHCWQKTRKDLGSL